MPDKNSNLKGFTLVELSIVIVIIGLIIAGVTTGKNLISEAQLRTIINDNQKIQSSISTFYMQYNALPGDIKNATSYFSGTDNGNGNMFLVINANSSGSGSSEVGRVFQHLSKAGLYPGDFTPGNVLASTPNMAAEGPQGGRYILTSYNMFNASPVNRNHIAGRSRNVLSYGKPNTNRSPQGTMVGYGALKIAEAKSIDEKIDDGLARSGKFSGHNDLSTSSESSPGCLKFPGGAATSDTTGAASYNLGTNFMCNISFDTPW